MKENILEYNQLFYIKYFIDLEKKCVVIFFSIFVLAVLATFVLFGMCFSKILTKWSSYHNVLGSFIISSL